jgi:hypothetical protein
MSRSAHAASKAWQSNDSSSIVSAVDLGAFGPVHRSAVEKMPSNFQNVRRSNRRRLLTQFRPFTTLFAVRCSLFAVRCSLFAVRCSLFAVRCSLFAVFHLGRSFMPGNDARKRVLLPPPLVQPRGGKQFRDTRLRSRVRDASPLRLGARLPDCLRDPCWGFRRTFLRIIKRGMRSRDRSPSRG